MDTMKLPPPPLHLLKRPRFLDGYFTVAYIPEDIIFDKILIKLPARSLVWFRVVCKKWNERIRSKDFIEKHLKYHSLMKESHFLLTNSDHGYYQRPLSIMKVQENGAASIEATYSSPPHSYSLRIYNLYKFKVASFCRGLVCATASTRNSRFPQVVFVWNPFTRACKEFPYPALKSRTLRGEFGKPSMCLGYDPISDDYKIVLVGTSKDSDDPLHIEILSLKTKAWRTLETTDENRPAGAIKGLTTTQAVASDDRRLYLALTVTLASESVVFRIFKFNLSEEKFARLEAPPIAPDLDGENYKLGLYNGSLCLYHMSGDTADRFGRNVDIWISQPDGIWSKFMHIPEELSREIVPGYKWSRRRDQPFDVGVISSRFGILHRTWQRKYSYSESMWRRSLSLHDPEYEHVSQQVSLEALQEASGADFLPTESLVSP